jgi:methylaspartate mutase epsilon subunit
MLRLENRRWEKSYFEEGRDYVLNSWSTGQEVDLEDAFHFHKSLPESKRAYCKLLCCGLNLLNVTTDHKVCQFF